MEVKEEKIAEHQKEYRIHEKHQMVETVSLSRKICFRNKKIKKWR